MKVLKSILFYDCPTGDDITDFEMDGIDQDQSVLRGFSKFMDEIHTQQPKKKQTKSITRENSSE